MNILYINHYAGSPDMGMEFRPYHLSKEWIKMGHKVDIVAADYSHLRINNPTIRKDFDRSNIDGINYYWIRTPKYKGNGLKRIQSMLQFAGKIYIKAKWIAKKFKPDVIITSSTYPLDTYAGQRIRKYRNKARLIHEIHDMWPAVLTEVNGMSKYHPFVVAMQLAENSFCKHADAVVSLPPCSKRYLIKHGMREDKYISIVNGINTEDWEKPEKLNTSTHNILKNLRNQNKFIICFFGSMTNYYSLPELIQAVQALGNENVVVAFVGDGSIKQELEKQANNRYPELFFFLNKIPKKQIPELLKMVDALYVAGVKNSVFKYGICMNKLFDSMMSGKPILYAVDAPNNYIVKYNCGVSVAPGDVSSLKEGINKLYRMSLEERMELGNNGHRAAIKYFTYEKLAKKFEKVF